MAGKCSLKGSLSVSGQKLSGSISSTGGLTGGISRPRDGTRDYEELGNKPKINGVVLIGDRSFEDLGEETMTNIEIATIFNRVFGGN